MSNTKFWKPVYRLFKPEEPLAKPEDLRDFYVQRPDSPVEDLVSFLEMADEPMKFLLAGHRGGGKTTELRRVEQLLAADYAVIWIDTETALDRYNIGYAEVVVLIGQEICCQAIQPGWWSNRDERLLVALEESLTTVVYQEKERATANLALLPDVLEKMGLVLKRGLTREFSSTLNIRPQLSEVIDRVNEIIKAAERDRKQKLVVIVDGLDRHDQRTALEMFASPLLTELNCHLIYTIPISLRYSSDFRQPMESYQCLDLVNLPVFECDENCHPTTIPHQASRKLLSRVISQRLTRLDHKDQDIFTPDAVNLLCEKSGGVMRDLIRLARMACRKAAKKEQDYIDRKIAEDAVKEEHKSYTLSDYHFPELAKVHETGRLTSNLHRLPSKGEFVICDELLQNKFVLGYYDEERRNTWFDVHPILIDEVKRMEN
ncbi:MAG: AAA family ATPase [Symploca sp. SIO2E6]|nr:AAA family ATPase [Symploca sp. SIO2E6]